MSISAIPAIGALPSGLVTEAAGPASTGQVPFGEILGEVVQKAASGHQDVNGELQRVVTGEAGGVHELVVGVAQADLAFRMVLEIRDRLIASYHEIMRMQV